MNKAVAIRRAARHDLLRHAEHIYHDSPSAAARFLDAARETFARLAEFPELGSVYEPIVERLSGMRRFRIKHFDGHLIFYRIRENGVEIVRVIHGARDIGAAFQS